MIFLNVGRIFYVYYLLCVFVNCITRTLKINYNNLYSVKICHCIWLWLNTTQIYVLNPERWLMYKHVYCDFRNLDIFRAYIFFIMHRTDSSKISIFLFHSFLFFARTFGINKTHQLNVHHSIAQGNTPKYTI